MLSAQCTDEKVNKATPALFGRYPDPAAFSKAEPGEIEPYIRSLGLYRNKAANAVKLSKVLAGSFGGEVPDDFDALTALPGVGKKTAGVVLAECFDRPAIPVDTHIGRVSARLGYVKEGTDPYEIEKKLERLLEKEEWIPFHHRFIAFGRSICKAKGPLCGNCPFNGGCPYLKARSKASRKS